MPMKVWSAEELEAMTPAERRDVFERSVVTDPTKVPPPFLARIKARTESLIAGEEGPRPD